MKYRNKKFRFTSDYKKTYKIKVSFNALAARHFYQELLQKDGTIWLDYSYTDNNHLPVVMEVVLEKKGKVVFKSTFKIEYDWTWECSDRYYFDKTLLIDEQSK